MLELFKDEIPKLDALVEVLKTMLSDHSKNLEDIREVIYDHIIETEYHSESKDEKKASEAMNIAYNAVDDITDELETNSTNFKRLVDYIKDYHSYNAYNRLIVDFADYMSDEQKVQLVKQGKKIFVKDLTQHWE